MMNDNLKPCPFCKSKKVVVLTEIICCGHGLCLEEVYVECLDCKARSRGFDNYDRTKLECMVLAEEAWNKRAGE